MADERMLIICNYGAHIKGRITYPWETIGEGSRVNFMMQQLTGFGPCPDELNLN